MPHLDYCGLDLDARYASIVAPDDERLEDLNIDECDQVYQSGLRAAEEIRKTMRIQGRRRRIATMRDPTKEQAKEGLNGVQGLSGVFDTYLKVSARWTRRV